ncbi:TlpA family protein disulfide reductase [Mucilaginibacter sp. FT3.2]|uniref:TlpA family protein disulfide reductase n=1 Tax=Mucilaginibacter sp. FT3.2 TaxID=2723090 RepID=UPI0016199995|nr:TlpA disulfide reductase family protein [Mucilaginibacter sp. FT3.2]MBB6232729.1 peroxiredoxin [Mucilaginibacter sp. FT3.2]
MRNLSAILFLILGLTCFNAQSQSVILKQAVERISTYTNMNYVQLCRQQGPFTADVSSFNIKAKASGGKGELFDITDAMGYEYLSNGSELISLDIKNKTYSIEKGAKNAPYNTPYFWLAFIQNQLKKSPEIAKNFPDTIVNAILCYHIKFPVKNSKANYEIYDLYLSKANYLPVYTREYLQGKLGKGNVTSNTIAKMVTENFYSSYNVNQKKFQDLSLLKVPLNYNPEKKLELLTVGSPTPIWSLKDLSSKSFSNNNFRGKITLMDFSFISCAACELSLPALNRLYLKYKDKNFNILTINVFDKEQSLLSYAKKNDIKYPILINGKNVSNDFKVSAFPSFYLINKKGKVTSTTVGYSEDFEQKIAKQIDNQLP